MVTNNSIVKHVYLLVIFSLFYLQIACVGSPIPEKYKPFFQLTEQQQYTNFEHYNISQQIDLAMLNYSHTHPRSRRIHRWIASKGESNVPVLIQQLNSTKDEYKQKHIIEIFNIMATEYYSLQNKQGVIISIKLAISNMKDGSFKKQSEKMLQEIQQ